MTDQLDRTGFLAWLDEIAPEASYGPSTRLDEMGAFHRVALTRWLADLFAQPTDLDIVRQFATVEDAWAWVDAEQRRGEQPRPAPPPGSTRVRLRPLADRDLPALYEASLDPRTSSAWRYRGRTLPVDEFVAGLHDGVCVQFVAELVATATPVGLVVAYDHSQTGLHCKVGLLRFGERRPGDNGAVIEAMVVFLRHLFTTFPYRKVFAEVPAYNLWLVDSGFAVTEGVLGDYYFRDGEWVDQHIASIDRPSWERLAAATGW